MSPRSTHVLGALVVVVGLALAMPRGAARGQSPADPDAARPPAADVAPAEPPAAAVLRVVVAGSPPFVVGEAKADGLAVDIWTALANELGAAFELTGAASVAEALDLVAAGKADVAVGPISITAERAEKVAFSQPYFQSHLSIAAAPTDSWADSLRPFLSTGFLSGVGALLLILVVVGTLVWLAERKGNPEHFPPHALPGIGNGVWTALVTMTTVGYGDRVPRTTLGRTVIGVWMLLAMLIAGSLIAFMSSAFTVSKIDGDGITSAEDLRDRRVAVVEGTTSESFAQSVGGRPVGTTSLADAAAAVSEGRADAVVFDRPALQYYLQTHPETSLSLADAHYEPSGYGFAMALGNPLRQRVDIAILRLQRSGRLATLTERWLGTD